MIPRPPVGNFHCLLSRVVLGGSWLSFSGSRSSNSSVRRRVLSVGSFVTKKNMIWEMAEFGPYDAIHVGAAAPGQQGGEWDGGRFGDGSFSPISEWPPPLDTLELICAIRG